MGDKQYRPLSTNELQSFYDLLDHETESTEDASNTVGIFVRSIFLPKHGPKGLCIELGRFV